MPIKQVGANMLKVENYYDPSKMVTVWKFSITDAEIVMLDFTPKEKVLFDRCNAPGAPISMIAAGLALIARKIEQQGRGTLPQPAPDNQMTIERQRNTNSNHR